ncbi:Hypothetical protein SMAX5B_000155 [Scophthalmus maximus]|uniref:Uncharacterized protein n=1 Tax=Scophthalmus maximus TaxID=52904 RepID=A0A2U9CVS0_SCOMX|nr:Hypothetical protein SMAX5B_000155 [Scophthalmus maximus]
MHLCSMAPPAAVHNSPHSGGKTCVKCYPQTPQSSGGREADSFDSAAEDGLSSLDSELRAALECCWVSVGLGHVQATSRSDNQVSHITGCIHF